MQSLTNFFNIITCSSHSSKVQKLIDLLVSKASNQDGSKKEDFCGIVYVEQRVTAVILSKLVNSCEKLSKILKTDYLVGHGTSDTTAMKSKEQSEVVKKKKKKFARFKL